MALRENNVRFQVENFKLQRKVKEFESTERNFTRVEVLSGDHQANIRNQPGQRYANVQDVIIEEIVDVDEFMASCGSDDVEEVEEQVNLDEDLETPEQVQESERTVVPGPSKQATLSKIQKAELAKIKPGAKNDSQFICKLLMMLFNKETLMDSSVTGKPSKNGAYESKGQKSLDKNKMSLCKREFPFKLCWTSIFKHSHLFQKPLMND